MPNLLAGVLYAAIAVAEDLEFYAGDDPRIDFAGATLRASCSPGEYKGGISFLELSSIDYADPVTTVSVRVGLANVLPSCAHARIRQPCARHDSAYPPLFYCHFTSAASGSNISSVTGPVAARPVLHSMADFLPREMAVGIELNCSLPPYSELKRIGYGVVGDGTDFKLTFSMTHFAANGTDALSIPYQGVPGGDELNLVGLPQPSPPSPPPTPPPSPPPPSPPAVRMSETVFVAWGENKCPSPSWELYKGFIAGMHHNTGSSGTHSASNFLCIHERTQYPTQIRTGQPSHSDNGPRTDDRAGGQIWGAEWENTERKAGTDFPRQALALDGTEDNYFFGQGSDGNKQSENDPASCVVCAMNETNQVYYQWGRQTCDWRTYNHTYVYRGAVHSANWNHYRTEHICVNELRREVDSDDGGRDFQFSDNRGQCQFKDCNVLCSRSDQSCRDQDHARLYVVEVLGETGHHGAPATGYPEGRELGCVACATPAGEGAVFTHWGSNSCPSPEHTHLYRGFMAHSGQWHRGGGYNFLCLHQEPEYPRGYSARNRLAPCESPCSGAH
jgi:hypothetical protein